jgi:hypothetical protein
LRFTLSHKVARKQGQVAAIDARAATGSLLQAAAPKASQVAAQRGQRINSRDLTRFHPFDRFKNVKDHRYWSVVEKRRGAGGRAVDRQVAYFGETNDGQKTVWEKYSSETSFVGYWGATIGSVSFGHGPQPGLGWGW